MNDETLKRLQLILAILTGIVTLVVGTYNVKSLFFSKSTGPGNLSVSVVSADRNQPVAGAALELYSSQNAIVSTATTDAQGHFQKNGLDAGTYSLKASVGGYETTVLPLSVQSDKTSSFVLSLRPSGSPVRSALEEVGASWIKNIGSPKQKSSTPENSK